MQKLTQVLVAVVLIFSTSIFAQEKQNEKYGDKLSAFRNGSSVDIPPVNTSKVTGVYEYAKMFDTPEIYAVGDNINDLAMIKEFCGFAVSNAKEEVKKAADHQCNRIADMIEFIMNN